MNSTKAEALVASGNLAYICPVSGKTVKAENTKRIDIEVDVKNKEGKVLRSKMLTLRVAQTVYNGVNAVLKAEDETVE